MASGLIPGAGPAKVVAADLGAAAAAALPVGVNGEAGFAGLRVGRDRRAEVGQGSGADAVNERLLDGWW